MPVSLQEQALKFIDEGKTDRLRHKPWHLDVYRYCMPWRRRHDQTKQIHDQDDLFDSTAIEALSDFSADMQLTFTPVEEDWLDVEPNESMDKIKQAQIRTPLTQYKNTIFSEIRRSNFHEASQESYPDLGTGTCAMCIQDYDVTQPVQCQAIPITDLLIVRGVYGGLDFRCRIIGQMKLRDVKPSYPSAKLDQELLGRIANDPGGTVEVHECFWRLWEDRSTEKWQYVLLIAGKQADDDVLVGPGSCPIIAARWRTDSTTAWGIGPLYVVLPTIKTLDQLNYLVLKQLSFAVDPSGMYDDDGVVNLEQGITPGTWIPRAAGSKFDVMKSEAEFDTTFYERTQMQSDIKRALFQDKPIQRGDTPPTAAQWMDQKAEIARRMGAPIGRLVTEWQWAIFQRYAYILEKRGKLPGVELNGNAVQLRPSSPLIKAQRQNTVITADRFLEIGGGRFGPQVLSLAVDPVKTLANIKAALGDELVEMVDPAQVKQALQNIAQVAQQGGITLPPGGGGKGIQGQ